MQRDRKYKGQLTINLDLELVQVQIIKTVLMKYSPNHVKVTLYGPSTNREENLVMNGDY